MSESPNPTRVAHRYASRIPQRVRDAAEDFRSVLDDWGVRGARVKPFNSGVVGIKIEIPGVPALMYLDQPGVVGLDDQNTATLAFGEWPLRNRRGGDVYYKKPSRNWGDVQLTEAEFAKAWQRVMFALEKRLTGAGYVSPY